MSRKEYLEADAKDKIAYIGSRSNVLSKSFATDLWMKVIHRAIDDIVTYKVSRDANKVIREEDKEAVNDAYGFLFHDEYKIPFDDYMVNIECSECKVIFITKMSVFAGGLAECERCNKIQNINISSHEVTEGQQLKEINLKEILQFWAIEDLKGFRSGVRERIEELIKRKKKAAERRATLKKGRQAKQKIDNNRIVLDYQDGVYTWKFVDDSEKECINVDDKTIERWSTVKKMYELYQQELLDLDNLYNSKK